MAALLLIVLDPDLGELRNKAQDLFGYGGSHSDDAAQGRDLFHTGVDISGMKGGRTYTDFDSRRDRVAGTSFYGFGCPGSCGEHLAGHRWAVRHEISKPAECGGLTWGFVEGCAAYATPRATRRQP